MKKMSEVGEIGMLKQVLPQLHQGWGVVRGPGDDCAVLRLPGSGMDLLATTDPVIEGRHYLAGTPWAWVARKAVGRAVSDIAAMGGVARWLLTDVTAGPGATAEEVAEIYRGLERAARGFGASIVGGDLSEAGEVQVHVVALGTCARGRAILRSGAKPGDVLLVTGRLGASWAEGNRHQFWFTPRLRQGQWLAERRFCHAMMDLSDGLGADLPRLLDASGELGCVVRPESLPCSAWARRMEKSAEGARARAWGDGEDFELLMAVPASKVARLERDWSAAFPGLSLTAIGMVLPKGEGRVFLDRNGSVRQLRAGGFEHFAG